MSKITVETIGPKEARAYLDAVRGDDGKFANRRIEPSRVSTYARAMETPGAYDPHLPTIAFNGGNKLVGGFHTLLAVERSGTKWDLRVVRGLTENLIAALNDQRKGSAADELTRLGYSDANQIASAARVLLSFDNGRYTMRTGRDHSIHEVAARAIKALDEENLAEALTMARHLYAALKANKTVTSVAFVTFLKHLGREETEVLFDKLINGIDLQRGDPATALRSRLERLLVEQISGNRATANVVWFAFLKTAGAIWRGESASLVRLPRDITLSDLNELIWWTDGEADGS